MKKFEHLGKKLGREEQKAISGGSDQWANTMCKCYLEEAVPLCDTTCSGVYAQCDNYCGGSSFVESYGTCEILGACR